MLSNRSHIPNSVIYLKKENPKILAEELDKFALTNHDACMKRRYLILFLSFVVCISSIEAQDGVGIGTDSPDPSAILHIQSPSSLRGLLIPRYDSSQLNAIPNEANGLISYNTENRNIAYYDEVYDNDDGTLGRWLHLRGVPLGAILMWSGSSDDIPHGYALCDGSIVKGRRTPNLVSSFIRGATTTSTDFTGALDVIPNLSTIDDNLIYNINTSFVINTPCSAYEFIYTTEITYSNCADPTQNNVFTVERLGNTCVNFPFPSPIDCDASADYCITQVPNPNYYMLTLEDCLNDNILLYWDVAYIMRVE